MSDLVKKGEDPLSAALTGIIGEQVDLTQRPSFIPEGDKTGTEGITSDDIRLPRLGIAQGLSPQVTPGKAEYMEDLKLFQMFNDSTREIYGKGPMFFIVVRRDLRCIEFRPRSEGGGVVDLNVPLKDPRATQWREVEVDGVLKRLPPVATTFTEFISLLIKKGGEPEPIVISIKHTNKHNRRSITDLNGYIKMHASQGVKSVPIYGVIYAIETRMEQKDAQSYGVPSFKQVGFVPPQMRELYERAREYAKELQGKNIVINREPGDEGDAIEGEIVAGAGGGDTSFDTSRM